MRRGITPVVAIVLLLMMTVAASGGAYAWMTGVIGQGQEQADTSLATSVRVVDARCEAGGGVVAFTLKNDGSTDLVGSNVDVYAFDVSDGNLVASTTLDLGSVSTDTVVTDNTTLDTAFFQGQAYRVEFAFEDVSASATCQAAKRCPSGFVPVHGVGGFCIMQYEASRADATDSSGGSSTTPVSQKGVVPWAQISQTDAETRCQNAGYHLANNTEWQAATGAVIGDSSTFVHGNNNHGQASEDGSETCTDDPTEGGTDRCLTGTGPESWESAYGVDDLNGNVWEWTSSFYGQGSSCDLGSSNYIASWNNTLNCPASLAVSGQADFGSDHYWYPNNAGDGAVRRGGDWNNGARAGPWAMSLLTPPSDSDSSLGFRCAVEGTVG